jgi:tetratricopeptide (TPR) repeat protein
LALLLGVVVAAGLWWKLNVAMQEVCLKVRAKAQAHAARGELVEAEGQFKKALTIALKLKSNRALSLARAFEDLTRFYAENSRWTEAQDYCLQAISNMEEPGTPTQRMLPGALELLASIYARQKNYRAFEKALEKSYVAFANQAGSSTPEACAQLLHFARLCDEENRPEAALRFYAQALPQIEMALGPASEPAAVCRYLMGLACRNAGQFGEAATSLEAAQKVFEKVFGALDPKLVPVLEARAQIHSTEGSFAKALPFLEKAISIREDEHGLQSPAVGCLLVSLSQCQLALGEIAKAEAAATRAAQILETARDENLHTALGTLDKVKAAHGEGQTADRLFSNAIRVLQQSVGSAPHPALADYLDERADVIAKMGRSGEANQLRMKASEVRQNVLPA